MITKEKKSKAIADHKINAKDTGSAPVQIAILTARIQELTEHFKIHKKDNHGKTGLLRMVNTRKKLLAYLAKTDKEAYEATIAKLGLRK